MIFIRSSLKTSRHTVIELIVVGKKQQRVSMSLALMPAQSPNDKCRHLGTRGLCEGGARTQHINTKQYQLRFTRRHGRAAVKVLDYLNSQINAALFAKARNAMRY